MAETPKRDNTHGEELPETPFGSVNSNTQNQGVYDSEKDWKPPTHTPDTSSSEGDSPTSQPGGNSGAVDRNTLNNQESSGASGSTSSIGDGEQSLMDRLNQRENAARENGARLQKEKATTTKPKFGRLRNFRPNKKQIATLAIVGILSGGGFFTVAFLSGPFQFIHMAQRLQGHFRNNEDFSNGRTSKMMLYALAGKDVQKGRLGITSNVAADKWEKKFLDKSGLRPVYSDPFRRFVGFEIVNDNKFQDFIGDQGLKDNRTSRKLEALMGDKAQVVNANDVRDKNNTKLNVVNSNGQIDNDRRILNLSQQDFGDRRAWIKTLGRATDTNNLVSSLGSRLLIKRAGVNFHPINKLKSKIDDAAAKRIRKERADNISNGVEEGPNGVTAQNGKDADGNETPPSAADSEVSNDTEQAIDEFKNSGALRSAKGAAAITGILCVTKSLGNSVEDYKYTNNALPMMRLGMNAVTTGNQAMSGDDIDLGTMKIMSEYLYDKDNKTSWTQAESLRAQEGKSGGQPIPSEAALGTLTEKPKFFQVIDDIPVLGTVCDVQNLIGNLPIIKQAGDAFGKITGQVADAALSLGGTSTDELMTSSLKALAGKSVDPESKGANFGSLADSGVALAAADQGISMGGKALTPAETSELNQQQIEDNVRSESTQSIAERYLDVKNHNSVAAAFIDSMPSNTSQTGSMMATILPSLGSSFGSLFTSLTPKAKAASSYNYGIPEFGFSPSEQRSDEYENPFENGTKYVEPNLDSLNEKYGDKCFGMTVTNDDSGVHIQTSKAVNVFKTYNPKSKDYKAECNAAANTDDRFNHYRMYIADALTAVALACDAGDSGACTELGIGDGSAGDGSSDNSGDNADDSSGEFKIQKIDDPLHTPGGKISPKGITLHWWGSTANGRGVDTLVDALRTNPTCSGGCSVQLGITADGKVYQLTNNLTDLTYHAIGANQTTFGIEIEGGPEQFGKDGIEKYPKKFEAVVATVKYLVQKYNIPVETTEVKCGNVSGIHPHKAYNDCPGAYGKDDIDDYYFDKVMERVKQ